VEFVRDCENYSKILSGVANLIPSRACLNSTYPVDFRLWQAFAPESQRLPSDREFATLAHEVDAYAQEVSDKTGAGDLDIEINSTSVMQYLLKKTASVKSARNVAISPFQIDEDIIDELRVFGIITLSDLDRILSVDLFTSVSKHQEFENYIGLLRDAMMYADLDRYFDVAWRNSWEGIDDDTIALLAEKYGKRQVTEILSNYGVRHLRDLE
jgi:putative GTP pyrophosphokinase